MSKMTDKYKKQIKDRKRRKDKRLEIMGEDGMYKQYVRELESKVKAVVTGKSVSKAKGKEAIKRVGEYRKGKFEGFKAGGKTEARPTCRGMGQATRGGSYGK